MSESSEELKRIANAIEEILKLVKLDQEATKKRFYDEVVKAENNDE
jgi:predicted ribonuclease toxin of YeeF-YezG toxin-antitoxin module